MKQDKFIVFEALQLYWCIFHLANLVMYIEPCHLTYKEMKRTHVLVSRLMHHTNSIHDPLAVELREFCAQLDLNKGVSYTPLNVITIKRSLLITIVGNITRYLVILIHMK